MKRRDFLRAGAVTAFGAGMIGDMGVLEAAVVDPRALAAFQEADRRALAAVALDAARSAGASYADVRISANRTQGIATREARVQGLVDNETFGFGVRGMAGTPRQRLRREPLTPSQTPEVDASLTS